MAADHLLHDPAHDVARREGALFLAQPRQKRHLQQNIPEFFAQAPPISGVEGGYRLVTLLEQVSTQAFPGLLAIPGTASGAAQTVHDFNQFPESFVVVHLA
jgi:hypothetical protein